MGKKSPLSDISFFLVVPVVASVSGMIVATPCLASISAYVMSVWTWIAFMGSVTIKDTTGGRMIEDLSGLTMMCSSSVFFSPVSEGKTCLAMLMAFLPLSVVFVSIFTMRKHIRQGTVDSLPIFGRGK